MTVPEPYSFLQLLRDASDADAPRVAIDTMNRLVEDEAIRASVMAELLADVDLDDYNEPKDLVLFCVTEALCQGEKTDVPSWAKDGLGDIVADLHESDFAPIRTLRTHALLEPLLRSASVPEEVPAHDEGESDHEHEHVLGGEGGGA